MERLLPDLIFFSKLCMLEDKFKRDNFYFRKKFKFPMEFELKIQGAKQSLIWFKF
jgi:hypothetical protein